MGMQPIPYEGRQRAGGSAMLPGAPGGSFGQDVAGAIGELGGAMADLNKAAQTANRNEEWARVSVDFERSKAESEDMARQRRSGEGRTASAGWAGHADMVEGESRQRFDQLLAGIADPVVRRQMAVRVETFIGDQRNREGIFETTRSLQKLADDTKTAVGTSANSVRLAEDVTTALPTALADFDKMVDGYDVAPDIREGFRREGEQTLLQAGINNLIASNPAAARVMLGHPSFAALEPGFVETALRGIEAEEARRAAAARAQDAADKAAARQVNQTRQAELDTGAGTPQDWEKLAQSQEAAGDPDGAVRSRSKGRQMQAALHYRGHSVGEMDARIATLNTKQAAGGLTPAEADELTGLSALRTQTAARLSETGGALEQQQFATGRPVAQLDLDDPATFKARGDQALAAASQYGRAVPEPLLAGEVEPLKDMMAGGPDAQLKALRVIGNFGDPRLIEGAARQISGEGDGAFRMAARALPSRNGPQIAQAILRGPDALRANPGVFDDRRARSIFAEVAPALAGMGADFASDTFEAARGYYAEKQRQAGRTEWNADAWRSAVQTMVGGYREGGQMRGGWALRGGQLVVIPEGWTQEGLFGRLSRITPQQMTDARVTGAARWPDGSKLYSGQLRDPKVLVPVWMGKARYGFRSPRTGNFIQSVDGGPYVIDFEKVPW